MVTRVFNAAELPAVMPAVPDASEILGMGRATAYAALQAGTFPVRVLRIGSRYKVSRADLLAYLGEAPVSESA